MEQGDVLLIGFAGFYLAISLFLTVDFYSEDKFYSKRKKILHVIFIWLIPFVWGFILRSQRKKVDGSHFYTEKRKSLGHSNNDDGIPYDINDTGHQ